MIQVKLVIGRPENLHYFPTPYSVGKPIQRIRRYYNDLLG